MGSSTLLLATAARRRHEQSCSPAVTLPGEPLQLNSFSPDLCSVQKHRSWKLQKHSHRTGHTPAGGAGFEPRLGFPQGLAGSVGDPPRFSPSSIRDKSCIMRSIWATMGSFSRGRTSSAVGREAGYTGTAGPSSGRSSPSQRRAAQPTAPQPPPGPPHPRPGPAPPQPPPCSPSRAIPAPVPVPREPGQPDTPPGPARVAHPA